MTAMRIETRKRTRSTELAPKMRKLAELLADTKPAEAGGLLDRAHALETAIRAEPCDIARCVGTRATTVVRCHWGGLGMKAILFLGFMILLAFVLGLVGLDAVAHVHPRRFGLLDLSVLSTLSLVRATA